MVLHMFKDFSNQRWRGSKPEKVARIDIYSLHIDTSCQAESSQLSPNLLGFPLMSVVFLVACPFYMSMRSWLL